MISINNSLWIARDSLVAHQSAIAVTGQNISNVNTPNYSRQRVVLETNPPMPLPMGGMVGQGVHVQAVQRIYDRFVNARLNTVTQDQGRWEAQQQTLGQIEGVFQENGDTGISSRLSAFFNSWQDVASNPSGYAERLSLVSKAQDLAQGLKQYRDALSAIQQTTDQQIRNGVDQINAIAQNLNALNDQIVRMKQVGQNPNDLEDKRDALLGELSGYVDFTTNESADGLMTVTLGDGKVLVGKPPEGKLVATDNAQGFAEVAWDSDPATPISEQIGSGKMKGWIESRDVFAQNSIDRMDTLAKSIIDAVNGLHQAGKGLDGSSGRDFFIGTGANDMAVDPEIEKNPDLVAAASSDAGYDTLSADNHNALAISALQDQAISDLGSAGTFSNYMAQTTAQVGQDVQSATQNLSYQQSIVTQLNNYRDSVSGVSLDEEMVNLIQFQHGYAAAARLVSTVNEMMRDLVNMV